MRGLLLLCFDYSKVAVDEFNDWYDTEHIPERQRTRGILNAHRWLAIGGSRISVASYDLQDIAALKNSEYLAISGSNSFAMVQTHDRQMHPGFEIRRATVPAG